MQNPNGRGASSAKVFPRTQRAETRNRAKDELKRVINAVDKVRKWERRWVVLKDSSINVYKWVPVTGQSVMVAPKSVVVKTVPAGVGEDTNASIMSAENSNDETNVTAASRINFSNTNNEDSNGPAFSEVDFGNSDSNQTETFDRVDYKLEEGVGGAQTDFSSMRREEAEDRMQAEPAPSRKRRANNIAEDEPPNTRKRSK